VLPLHVLNILEDACPKLKDGKSRRVLPVANFCTKLTFHPLKIHNSRTSVGIEIKFGANIRSGSAR